ncbi:hypothetical protein F4859DRAFT_517988 [Xylaria cf. heliscus]|nr:hypothetical protein F4859DRAFT_517988 [Xylaria cf. heliscus]
MRERSMTDGSQHTFFTTTSSTSTPSPSFPSSSATFLLINPPVAPESSLLLGQGISTGVKIAIGAGIGDGGLIILVASTAYFLLVRRNKRRQVGETLGDMPNGNSNNDPKLMKPEVFEEAWAPHHAELQTAENTHEINTLTPAVYPSHNSPWRSAQTAKNWPNGLPEG